MQPYNGQIIVISIEAKMEWLRSTETKMLYQPRLDAPETMKDLGGLRTELRDCSASIAATAALTIGNCPI